MSHIIPYISTEPPSIHEDSFEHESGDSVIIDYNFPKISEASPNENIETKKDYSIVHDQNNYPNHINQVVSRSPIELRKHIDNIIEKNDLKLDFTDSRVIGDNEDDRISECSFEGQFDAYIDSVNNPEPSNGQESMECCDTFDPDVTGFVDSHSNPFDLSKTLDHCNDAGSNNNDGDIDCEFGNFGEFSGSTEAPVDYFSTNVSSNHFATSFAFADFQETEDGFDVPDSACVNDGHDLDDEFDDFATFNDEPTAIVSHIDQSYHNDQPPLEPERPVDDIVDSFRQQLLTAIESVDIGVTLSLDRQEGAPIQSTSFISNHSVISDYGTQVWKELTNFDYSPAFIFHWMQSKSYEHFMNAMGPDYKELLSTQRVTLPLYSVNLTPLEPVPADIFVQTIHSTTSSSLDLTLVSDKVIITNNNISSKNSSIDIKNLEDEFIFNTNLNEEVKISNLKSDNNRSSLPNLSSAVVQSEGLGGLIKSMLKPLTVGGKQMPTNNNNNNKPMNPQTEAVLKDLPDLSYMTSKVLMFPVLASCDVEDNI